MQAIQFTAWPKIARLNRDIIITEKIDGTNAAIGIATLESVKQTSDTTLDDIARENRIVAAVYIDGVDYIVWAQSRTRLITTGATDDNYGFAKWVFNNAGDLARTLGEGVHFGEWWGSGINRGYGLTNGERRFSLFNTPRYGNPEKVDIRPLKDIGVNTVPVLYEGLFSEFIIKLELERLAVYGSRASIGFMKPEGIVIYHVAAGIPFKVTIVGDEKPKGSNEIG